MESDPARSETGAPRRGAPAQLLSVLVLLALVAGLATVHRLRRADPGVGSAAEAAPAGPVETWVDPAAARVVRGPAWVDPRWLETIRALCEEQEPIALAAGTSGAGAATAALAARLGALSFVERVERCALTPEGLALDLILRQPVACIPVADGFALVDEDGVVLAGRWPLPPRLGRAFLPVLGPLDDPLFARARDGDWLVEPEHTDALDVALSLSEHLDEERRVALGRIVIDARLGRLASVSEPGVRLELEGARLALFGRAPSMDAPGALPAGAKWRALARALALFEGDPVGGDWDLVDLRWDRPDLALRNAPLVAALEPAAPATRTRARASAGDDSRPRVR